MNIFVDIETISGTNIPDEYLKVDARLKDPEKIKASKLKSAEKSVFDGAFGEIVSIAWALDDSTIRRSYRTDKRPESEMLADFFQSLTKDVTHARKETNNVEFDLKWVGHNVQFDIGFLFKRSVILNVPSEIRLPWPCNAWDRRIGDTMYMWAGRDTVSLDKLAFVILGEKKTTTGADVAGMWERGEYEDIATYNMDDVDKTRRIYKRMAQ